MGDTSLNSSGLIIGYYLLNYSYIFETLENTMEHLETKQVVKFIVKPMTKVMAKDWAMFSLIHCRAYRRVGLRGRSGWPK